MSKYFKFMFSAFIALFFLSLFSCKGNITGNDNKNIWGGGKISNTKPWSVENFIIEDDVIYGFSELGAEKLKTTPLVVLPSLNSEGKQITRIAAYAFNPKKHSEISDWGVGEKDVDGFDVKDLGQEFSYQFKALVIPKGYEIIGQDAFTWNSELNEVVFADTIKLISEYAFAHTKINTLNLPKNLETINDSAFFDANIEGVLTLPENLRHIGERSFKSNRITNIKFLGEALSFIPEESFSDNKLKSIKIPNSITKIHDQAFFGNDGEREYGYSLIINTKNKDKNNSILKDGINFYVDPDENKKVNLNEIEFTKWLAKDFSYDGQTITGFSNSGKIKIRENKNLILPSQNLNGKEILKIAANAFRNVDFDASTYKKYDIESINIPITVKEIDDYAFQSNNIKNIVFGSESNMDELALERIGLGAFMNNKLVSLDFMMNANTLKTIDNAAFHMNSIEQLFVPGTVEKIGFSAFRENQINILYFMPGNDGKSSVSEIGEMAFAKNQITVLTLPEKLKVVPVQAFTNNNIKDLTLPEGLEKIEYQAFALNKLEGLPLPNSLKEIAFNAFDANPSAEKPVPVSLTTTNNNAQALADGDNFCIDENDKVTETEKTKLQKLISDIEKIEKSELRASTQKQYADMEVSLKALLGDTKLSKAKALKFIKEACWFMTRVNLDKKINLAEKALKIASNEKTSKLLKMKYDYAVKSYNNIAVEGEKLTRLEKEISYLTDLVNNSGEIASTTMKQGHHELKSPLPIPPYHIGVNVYFKADGSIYYCLDMSYLIGEGTTNKYGRPVENVDEDNEGYHVFAIDTLDKYEGKTADEIIKNTFETFAKENGIELNDTNRYHIEGMFKAIQDACNDFKK